MNQGRATRWAWDLVFAIVLMAAFAYATVTALSYPEGAKLFPLAIAIPSFLLAVVLAVISLRARGIPVEPSPPDPDDDPTLTPADSADFKLPNRRTSKRRPVLSDKKPTAPPPRL